MADCTQTERQLHILSLLSESRNGRTADEISSYLSKLGVEVSKRTVERDLDDLSLSKFPIIEEKRNLRTVYYAEKFAVKNSAFTITELLSLYFTREMMKAYSHMEIGYISMKIMDKIIAQLPQIDIKFMENLYESIKINPPDIIKEKSENLMFLDEILNASSAGRMIQMGYKSFNSDEITERVVEPYQIEIDDGCYHLIGFCHLRNEIRQFRVSRICRMELMDRMFTKPENFYENYKKKRFDKLSGEDKINLKLRFTGKSAKYVMEYEREKADQLEWDEFGGLIFEKSTTMTPEILKWVLGFGSEVDIREPEILKIHVANEVQKMSKKFL